MRFSEMKGKQPSALVLRFKGKSTHRRRQMLFHILLHSNYNIAYFVFGVCFGVFMGILGYALLTFAVFTIRLQIVYTPSTTRRRFGGRIKAQQRGTPRKRKEKQK